MQTSVKLAARGLRWSRDNAQSRLPSAKCCELYASLHDRFRLEVRILFYSMRTWKLAAWVTAIIAGMQVAGGTGKVVKVEGDAGVRGAAPVGSRGEAPAGRPGAEPPRLSRNELKMLHEQIVSRNEAWFVKIRKRIFSLKYIEIHLGKRRYFFLFCHSMNSLYTCSYRCRDFAGNNLLPMILSASAFNSCMIEFSIPDFNETSCQSNPIIEIYRTW